MNRWAPAIGFVAFVLLALLFSLVFLGNQVNGPLPHVPPPSWGLSDHL